MKLCRGPRTFRRHSNSSPNIGLAQLHAALLGLPYQSRARRVDQLDIGRKHPRLRLHGGRALPAHGRGRCWSGRERNRSCSPDSRRSFGRITIPPPDRLRRTEPRSAIRRKSANKIRKKIGAVSLTNWQIRILERAPSIFKPNGLRVLHGVLAPGPM